MNKWGFDAFYNRLFIQFGGEVAEKVLWKGIDRTVIDGTVNALAGGVGLLSRAGRRLQTGFVRNYALAMLIGVVILITGMFVTYQKVLLK
jgi:NADH-quinone oxidoreductase subunit L